MVKSHPSNDPRPSHSFHAYYVMNVYIYIGDTSHFKRGPLHGLLVTRPAAINVYDWKVIAWNKRLLHIKEVFVIAWVIDIYHNWCRVPVNVLRIVLDSH